MLTNTIFVLLLATFTQCGPSEKEPCLTGCMTDVQNWVDNMGRLLTETELGASLDLSRRLHPTAELVQYINRKSSYEGPLRYLSFGRCNLTAVPNTFRLRHPGGSFLSETLQYLSFYGNDFSDNLVQSHKYDVSMNASNAVVMSNQELSASYGTSLWSLAFKQVIFINLRELDLRACQIQIISKSAFLSMPNLEALYLGENNLLYIESDAFLGLLNIVHIDISKNNNSEAREYRDGLHFNAPDIFHELRTLKSLDLSHTKVRQKDIVLFNNLNPTLERLSICGSNLRFNRHAFAGTQLKYLDVSKNTITPKTLRSLENSLQVLYADHVTLRDFDGFMNFRNLEVLKVTNNEISDIKCNVLKSMAKLKVLDLSKNRIVTWNDTIYSAAPNLKLLSLVGNNINTISKEMLRDLKDVSYLGLSDNYFICNCFAREFLEIAIENENKISNEIDLNSNTNQPNSMHRAAYYHLGFKNYNEMIQNRYPVTNNCNDNCKNKADTEVTKYTTMRLFDFKSDGYKCFLMDEAKTINFGDVNACNHTDRSADYDEIIGNEISKILSISLTPIMFIIGLVIIVIYKKSWRLKYFYITVRNSAMLSFLDGKDDIDDNPTYNYDVFVSYCNEDRGWVLDHLLPHVERDCNVSVCLHERDFQVGLSILENIVSCMDRSRSIMLILSLKFLQSQWCQFEMHLAQHRLLETRREDLILILLEDIPRRRRPNTLHYLMLTKTYIIWPSEENDREQFWRRVKKTIITPKYTRMENTSLA